MGNLFERLCINSDVNSHGANGIRNNCSLFLPKNRTASLRGLIDKCARLNKNLRVLFAAQAKSLAVGGATIIANRTFDNIKGNYHATQRLQIYRPFSPRTGFCGDWPNLLLNSSYGSTVRCVLFKKPQDTKFDSCSNQSIRPSLRRKAARVVVSF